jgi:hypothetical protein
MVLVSLKLPLAPNWLVTIDPIICLAFLQKLAYGMGAI